MKEFSKIYLMLFVALLVWSCQDDGTFDNRLYIKSNTRVGEILLRGGETEEVKVLQAELAKPSEVDVTIVYKADESLVGVYNKAYNEEAVLLPADNYAWVEPKAVIHAGGVLSTEASILFKGFSALERETVYVLPVTIAESSVEVLQSARTYYYVIKSASLISVVADIDENYLSVNWANPDVVNNLATVTMEALVRARNFDKLISTVMGVENHFLIRIGDAGFPSNQIQIATGAGNFPSSDEGKGLPVNQWVHIALTYDTDSQKAVLYVDGKVQSEGSLNVYNVHLGNSNFFIGRSYDDNRWLAGEIAECRIWNVVRTAEEIAENPYAVDPESEGLVAYWKCNEGAGNSVKDHTANGNHAVANGALKWVPVTLPE